MFVTGQSVYAGLIFSVLSFLVAIPSAIKVFNWTATLYKGSISYEAPMLYALGFIGLFTMGGLTGSVPGVARHRRAPQRHLFHRRALPLHHGRRRGDGISGRHPFLVAQNFRPKISRRVGALAAAIIFIGFNLTFFPQFMLGYLGMPRRYAFYPAEFQVLNVMSSAGATVLGVGYLIPLDLSDLVDALRPDRGRQSVGRHGPGMEDAFAAADGKFRGNSRGDRGSYATRRGGPAG